MRVNQGLLITMLLLGWNRHVALPSVNAAEPEPTQADPKKASGEENPYLAGANLSRAELGKFLETMRRKPESIRQRPGFAAAMVDAADRILKDGADDELATSALLTKFKALGEQAEQGDKAARESLHELATARHKDMRESIALEAQFHLLQKRAQDSAQLDDDEVAKLLAELKTFFTKATLENRHVALASLTVALINRLDDDTAAASAYQQFGALWAKSHDRELSKYGRKIEKGPAKKEAPPQKAETPENSQPEDSGGNE